ncbi:MAG: T9SS type A sorting domain-containing protein [Saprospiraceae bacterium]|nr:T9SS type A sorting domain-containing protein [Saprospiraceae bacterium]MCB9324925.1 T9SS type A sorting domain-containing protein [Lewinellaceae bacterium]
MKNHLQFIQLIMLSFFLGHTALAQDFIFTQVPNPTDRYYDGYVGQEEGLAYVVYRNNNYDRFLYSFDGDDLVEIDMPEGFMYNWNLTNQNGVFYMTFYDVDYNTVLMSYQDGVFSQIEADFPNEGLGSYAFNYDGQVYVTYYSFLNFLNSLKVINGNTVENVDLPEGYNFGSSVGSVNGNMYVTLNDVNWNSYLFQFDGTNFEQVTLPEGTMSPYAITTTEDLLYLSLYDANFNSAIYTFDGTTFEALTLPEWCMGVGFVGELNGNLYFRLDDANYQGILYELDGNTWVEIPNPADFYLAYNPGTSENALYPAYNNNLTFEYNMAVYDGTDLTLVDQPAPGYTYSNFFADNQDGAFVTYYDPDYYQFLYFYNGTELLEVPIPAGEDALNYYEFAMDASSDKILFFSFRDNNYNSTLYWFGEPNEAPTAQDNLVYTLLETPYSFQAQDFNFSDLDLEDTLTAIQIVEKPSLGILHLNGANLATGQVINAEYLEDLTYVPMNDGLGEPYDSFKFRVFDGDDFSEAVYTMFINVVESIVSAEDLELSVSLNIYPNPASDFIEIDLGDYPSPEKVRMYFYNNNGVAIRNELLTSGLSEFNVSDLPKGIYHLVFKTENSLFSRKVILQ